jgi:arylformamidase
VSVALRSGRLHWPDNPPVWLERTLDIEHCDGANVRKISMGSHTGTHMDAPLHFVEGATGWTRCHLGATIRRAQVIAQADLASTR